jgi:hypothetical protein
MISSIMLVRLILRLRPRVLNPPGSCAPHLNRLDVQLMRRSQADSGSHMNHTTPAVCAGR